MGFVMSRVGNQPVVVPDGVNVAIEGRNVRVSGPRGELTHLLPRRIAAVVEEGRVWVRRESSEKPVRALHGTTRSLIANMVHGVQRGYVRELQIEGVGYRAQVQGQKLVLTLGFSHPFEYTAPEGISLKLVEGNKIQIEGTDKHLVGQVSALIRSSAPAEPYKGKGVRYADEYVRRKVGKTVA